MMKKFFLFGFFASILFGVNMGARAESICFSSADDFKDVKDRLPQILKELSPQAPLILASSTSLDATSNEASLFEVRAVDQKFQLVYRMKTRMFDGAQKTRYLKQLCVNDGNIMKATLESRGMLSIDNMEIKLNSDSTFSVMGEKFVKISESQRQGVVKKIEKLISDSKNTTNAGGPNASAQ